MGPHHAGGGWPGVRRRTAERPGSWFAGASPRVSLAVQILLLTLAYYVAARLSLRLALVEQNVTPIWPPTGIAVAALLVLGRRVWPGIAVAAFLVNASISPSPLTAAAIAAGNTLAPLLATQLLERVGFRPQLDRLRDAVALVGVGLVSMTVSATGGAITLMQSGVVPPGRLAGAWAVWWAGDASGVLIVTPFLLSLRFPVRVLNSWRRAAEAALLAIALVAGSRLAFGTALGLLPILPPLLIWAAWRFQLSGAAPAALFACAIGTWAAITEAGPFADTSMFETMIALQTFNASVAFASFVLAAMVAERERAREALQEASVELGKRVREKTAEIEEMSEWFRHAFEGAPVGVAVVELDGRWARVNQALADITGYTVDQLQGMRFQDMTHPDDLASDQEAVAGMLAGESESDHAIKRYVHADGHEVWVSRHASLIRDARGGPRRFIVQLVDITELKRAERALQRAHRRELAMERVTRAREAAEWAREAAESANRAKTEFLSRMSHELRTPLNVIMGFAQLLAMDDLTDDQRESVRHVLKGGEHLLDLINEALDISRIEAGGLALSLEPIGVDEVIREALDLIGPIAAERSTRVRGHSGPRDYQVTGDRQRVKQVLLNLLSNAVKYGGDAGMIGVSCHEGRGGRVRIVVTDTGPGIPSEKMGRLFTPFDRLDAEAGGPEGTGLGLALTKRLVEAMGGAIGAESEVGRGSSFWVELPAADGPSSSSPSDGPAGRSSVASPAGYQ